MFKYFLPLLILSVQLSAQTPRKPLNRLINLPSKDQVAPSLSGDGRTMLYMSTYSESGELEVKLSKMKRSGDWAEPEDFDVLNRWSNNNMVGGYFLSYDGKTVVFTSRKSPGIGKFDIWITEKRGNAWTAPVNLGKPLNSPTNEGAPSLSPDGKYLYFMRCESLSLTKPENCKIMVAERRGQYWNEPQELPASINAYNAAYPKIQGDGKTLIFSSDRPGGKGGMDFYLSRFENGTWQEPVNMSYLNTADNDVFVSIPLSGNIAYYSMMYRENFAIIKAQIPEDMKPSKVNFIDGKVTANGEPAEVFLQLYDYQGNEPVQYGRNNKDGSFRMIIAEGKNYDFSATPTKEGLLYYAKVYPVEEMESSKWERANIELMKLEKGVYWVNENISFEEGTAELHPTSEYELKRLIKMLRNNSDINVSLDVYTDEVIEDTVKSDPDLTEIRQDTVEYQVDSIVIDTLYAELDSMVEVVNEEMPTDTLSADEFFELTPEPMFETDTTVYQITKKKVIDIYHNDRTTRQAETLSNYFRSKGVPEDRFIILGLGDIDNLVDNSTDENRRKNRRVEVTLE